MSTYPVDFSVLNEIGEVVAAIRRHTDTYATLLGGSDSVLALLRGEVPLTHDRMMSVLSFAGYRLIEGIPDWVDSNAVEKRFTPKFWVPPGSEGWEREYSLEEDTEEEHQ